MSQQAASEASWPLRAGSLLLGCAATLAVLCTASDYGFAVDEATYLWAAREVRVWFAELPNRGIAESLSAPAIAARWHFLESPFDRPAGQHSNFNLPAAVHVMNVGWLIGHSFLHELEACRLGSALLFGLTVGVAVLTLGRRLGPMCGMLAGGLLIASPRVFGHAHFAATETPLVCFWLLTCFGLLEAAMVRRTRWATGGFSLAIGLLFATKLTAWLIAAPIAAWLLWHRPAALLRTSIAAAGGIVLLVYCLTPPLWTDPFAGIARLVNLSANNPWQIPSMYFGTAYGKNMPWHSGLMLLATTMPIATLLLGLIGLGRGLRESTACLFALNAVTLLAFRTAGLMPMHDGERQFIPLHALWCCLAAFGFHSTSNWVASRFLANRPGAVKLAGALVGLACLLEPAIESWTYRAHGLSFYSHLIGGLAGADKAGMEVSYWFEAATDDVWRAALSPIPVGSRVFLRPDHPGLDYLTERGIWRPDLKSGGPDNADYFLLYARKAAYAVPVPNTDRFQITDLMTMQQRAPANWESPRFQGVRFLALFRRR